ncbi:hypothetical protein ACWIG5_23730 [Streptomyces lydicus]
MSFDNAIQVVGEGEVRSDGEADDGIRVTGAEALDQLSDSGVLVHGRHSNQE